MKNERSSSVMPWSNLEAERNDSHIIDDDAIYYFDPNDKRYRCCCQQSHSTTGVRIIAGMLCFTVVLEVWHLCWFTISSTPIAVHNLSVFEHNNEEDVVGSTISSSAAQLLLGIAIAGTVIYALWRENAVFLLPYLMLQALGLAAVFVILCALIYITLANDLETIKAFLESHSPNMIDSYNDHYMIYMGWTMVGSCLMLFALQWWLISIVFSCWRYFRDKRNFGYAKGYNTSSFVVFRPSAKPKKAHETILNMETKIIQPGNKEMLRSISLGEYVTYNEEAEAYWVGTQPINCAQNKQFRPALHATFSSASYE